MAEKYQMMSEIEHILVRSGMYLGSTNDEIIEAPLYQPSTDKIIQVKQAIYNAGLMKMFDEILSNCVDEHRRKDALYQINYIKVDVNDNGTIKIEDNGGISVTRHKATGLLIPELIFGHLRTSSNYDDTQDRTGVGTNGLGAKLTNIFSEWFTLETADGKNQCKCDWSNNMQEFNVSQLEKSKEHFTRISFKIDLKRFGIEKLSMSCIRQMQKRCIDACATNPNLKIDFTTNIADGKLDLKCQFTNFGEYIKKYLEPADYQKIIYYKAQRFIIGICPIAHAGAGSDTIGFVNGALCSQGTHIKVLMKQIVDKVLSYCSKNDMELITERDIISRMTLFVNCVIGNPTYDSQTKERLTNKLTVYDLKITKEILDKVCSETSELILALKDFYQVKYATEQKKKDRKLNGLIKATKNTKKLISSTSHSLDKELWIFEGNSASGGFRKHRLLNQAAYLLRGKVKNTWNLHRETIVENQELREIIATLGLLFNKPTDNIRNLKYSKIIVATDADYDGSHICSLMLAFFGKHFKELITNNKIFRAISPIIICNPIGSNKGKNETKYFYRLEDFHLVMNEFDSKNWEIIYTKGLGGLSDDDYSFMLRQQKLVEFTIKDSEDLEALDIWFKQSTEQRKDEILTDSDE